MVIYLKYEKKRFITVRVCCEIILPHTFYALENEAFVGCSNLESITFLYDEQNAARDEWPFIDPSAVEGCVNLKTIYGYNGWGLDYDAKKIGAEFIALDKTPDVIPSFSIELGKYSETDAVKIFWKNALMYLGMRWRLVAHHIFRSGQIHLYTENLIILKISLTGLRPNQTVRIMYA